MKKRLLILLAASCIFILDLPAAPFGPRPVDTLQPSYQYLVSWYYLQMGESAHLYDGSEYAISDYQIKGNPFYGPTQLTPGSILFDQILYEGVPMLYDAYQDRVVINRYQQHFLICPTPSKISWFAIKGHAFVRLNTDTLSKTRLDEGFYEPIYNGELKLYAKRGKKKQETVSQYQSTIQYVDRNEYYLKMGEQYHVVGNKRSILSLFPQNKREIRKYLRKNNISFYEEPELALVSAVTYCDHLKK